MEFWIYMLIFIFMGGGCSFAGTWWSKNKKKDNKDNKEEK